MGTTLSTVGTDSVLPGTPRSRVDSVEQRHEYGVLGGLVDRHVLTIRGCVCACKQVSEQAEAPEGGNGDPVPGVGWISFA